jgi:hypothetical protein
MTEIAAAAPPLTAPVPDTVTGSVRRRKVFYIPGYDPFHPRRYRELYRKEARAQADVSGYDIALAPRSGGGPHGWRVSGEMDGAKVTTDIEVLVWSDIVKGSMAASIPATYAQLAATAWTYVTTGTLRRLMWLRKGPVIAALYPVGMLLAQLAVTVLIASLVARIAAWTISAGLALIGLEIGAWSAVVWWPVFLVLTTFGLRFWKAQDKRFFAYYLMHDYAFSCRWGGANPPALEARLAEFADRIAAALAEDHDEVLVVGHSSGAHLAVSVLADLIRARRVRSKGPALGFLSLGQVVPMLSFLPRADRLRADLAYLSVQPKVTWVDVTAPGDGCAFALCDPVAVSGVAPEGKRWPLVISAAFTQSLSAKRWKELRWRFFRLHFQYLCAFDRPRDYDYFRITAGPLTLAERYAERAPSKSRIDVPASKYTSMAA